MKKCDFQPGGGGGLLAGHALFLRTVKTMFPHTCLTIYPKLPNGCCISTSWRSGTPGQSQFRGRTPGSPSCTKRGIQGMQQTDHVNESIVW